MIQFARHHIKFINWAVVIDFVELRLSVNFSSLEFGGGITLHSIKVTVIHWRMSSSSF